MTARNAAYLTMLLTARTRALGRVVKERDHLATVHARIALYARAGREVYKRRNAGDEPVTPSDIIRTAEETHACTCTS